MTFDDFMTWHDLGAAYVTARIADCEFTFHRQRRTASVWTIVAGPLGIIAIPVAEGEMFDRMRATGQRSSGRPGPGPGGVRIPLDDELWVDLRVKGGELRGAYVFADGSPFGGMSGGLPSAERPSFIDRTIGWLRGRRGVGQAQYLQRSDRSRADSLSHPRRCLARTP
jgi:hypothetical protein